MADLKPHEFAGTDRYRVQRRIGEGGMGVVYEVYDRKRAATVALKTLLRLSPGAIYRFKREFRALADVSHPNLVTLHELVSEGDTWFYTMELVEGVGFLEYVRPGSDAVDPKTAPTAALVDAASKTKSLDIAIDPADITVDDSTQALLGQEPPPLHIDRLRHALTRLAEGLVALHDAGKLHRDLKPSNVMIAQERVVILDFGLATDIDEDSLDKSRMESMVGTVAYMPPEQAGGAPSSKAGDWYSVGVMLFRALTGRLPFTGTLYQVVYDKQQREPPLASELQSELPRDLVQLAADLLRTDPKQRPIGREILERLGGRVPHLATPAYARPALDPGPRLVGRERHAEALENAFARLESGRPVVLHVSGAAGIGKTTLVRSFLEDLRDRGRAHVFAGRCYEHELVPFKALDSLVDGISRALRRRSDDEVKALLPEGIGALARVFPVLNRVDVIHGISSQQATAPDPMELRTRAFAAFRGLLAALTKERPVVLFLDDLHFGDTDSAELLMDLLRPPAAPPLMLVAAYRTDDRDANRLLRVLRAPTDEAFEVDELRVGPLEDDAALALARAMLSEPDAPPRADDAAAVRATVPALPADELEKRARTIASESRGSPLFIFELARHAHAERASEVKEPSVKPRLTLDEAVHKRVAGLPREARRLLEVLAVAGRPLPRDVANRAAGLDPRDYAAPALLITQHLARTRPTAAGDEIECYHDRIRLSVRERLPADELKNKHLAIARAYGVEEEVDPTFVVEHLVQSGQNDEAAHAARRAANRSYDALAFDQAAALSSKAIELSSNDKSRYELFKEHAKALETAGRADAADAYLETAAEAPSKTHALEMKRRAAEQFLRFGKVIEGMRVLDEVLSAYEMVLPDSPQRAVTETRVHRARLKKRGLAFEERPRSKLDRDTLLQADACWSACVGLAMIDPLTAGIFTTRYLYLSLEAGDPNRIARALAWELALLTSDGKPREERTREVVGLLDELAERIDAPYVRGFAALGRVLASNHESRWQETLEAAREAVEILSSQCTGVDWELTTAMAFGIWARGYLGQVEGLDAVLEETLHDARTRHNVYASTILRMSGNANVVLLMADQPAFAKRELETARSEAVRAGFFLHHWWALASLVQIDMYTGQGRRAWRRVSKTWKPLRASNILRVKVIRCEALFLRARAALSAVATTDDHRPLLSAARQDADRLEKEGIPWTIAAALMIRGQANRGIGLAAEAAELFEQAAEGFDAAGMRAHAAVCRLRRGQSLGRSSGHTLVEDADRALRQMGVKNPPRYAALLCPG